MHIQLINPSLSGEYFKQVTERALKSLPLDPQIHVVFSSLSEGPATINSDADEALAVGPLLKEIKRAEESGSDAVVIHCFGDVALRAARETVRIPVVCPGETSILFGLTLGRRITIIPTSASFAESINRMVKEIGVDAKRVKVRSLDVPVLSSDSEETLDKFLSVARRSISEDEADVIILGCTGMSGLAKDLASRLGIPVIDPLFLAIKTAELQVLLNLSHSRKAYLPK